MMAETKSEEKIFTIPFRKIFKSDRMLRGKRAAHFVRAFLVRHMKVDEENVRIGKGINEAIWMRGIQKPPRRIKVHVLKNEVGTVFAELVGVDIKAPSKEELKKKAEKLAEKKKKIKEERKERKEQEERKKILARPEV